MLLSLLASIPPSHGNVTLGRHLLTGCLSSPQLGSLGVLLGVARTWLQQGFSGGQQHQVQWEDAELTHGLVNFVGGWRARACLCCGMSLWRCADHGACGSSAAPAIVLELVQVPHPSAAITLHNTTHC